MKFVINNSFTPQSENLVKLKLFLEKTKTDFIAENSDLLHWINDRSLQIDKLSFSQEETNKSDMSSVDLKLDTKLQNLNQENKPLATNISKEEYDSIIEKIINLLKLPAGQLTEDSELYLEQQLSDMLGFDISAVLDDHKLLFSTGIMEARPHLKKSPTDTIENHISYLEAGMNLNRSVFGWFNHTNTIDNTIPNKEKYYISLPLYHDPLWNSNYHDLKKWYKFRKVIVINPANELAIVCCVGDIGPNSITRKQFGGSPELIREGKIWSPQAQGKVLVLFVDDPENKVSFGPISLNK